MKRFFLTALLPYLLLTGLLAQQDPVITHYMYTPIAFNPAFSGVSGNVCATALNRQQWIGFKNAPSTTMFMVGSPFKLFNKSGGIGLKLINDAAGFDKDISLSLSYAYYIDLGTARLSIGFNAGMFNKVLDPDWKIPSGDYHTPPTGDPLIPEGKESYVAFDAGIGALLTAGNAFAGFSVMHLNQPTFKFSKGLPYLSRHYYLTGGYNILLPNPAFELTPSFLVFSDARIMQFTASGIVTYNKKAWGGFSYRSGDALTGILGLELYNGIRIGYGYDFPLSDIRRGTSGSHEFIVNYCFDISMGRSPMKYKSIRFL